MRHADWIVDVGPGAGTQGGRVLYSGPVAGLAEVDDSVTRPFLFADAGRPPSAGRGRRPRCCGCVASPGTTCATSTSTSRWACSPRSPGSRVRARRRSSRACWPRPCATISAPSRPRTTSRPTTRSSRRRPSPTSPDSRPSTASSRSTSDPIGRTPRSNLATYTGLFDGVRKLFAATDEAKRRGYAVGRFSFNVAGGRCENCQGEGFVAVELLFLPGTYSPCPVCHGARYNPETLEVTYRGRSIADVLALTVEDAVEFFADVPAVARSLRAVQRGGARLPHARPAGHRAVRRRGPAHQAGLRAAARPPRSHALPPRRADDRSAPGRHRTADGPAARPRRRRQHRDRHRARHGRRRPRRSRHRHRSRRWRRRRPRRRRAGHRPRWRLRAPAGPAPISPRRLGPA